MKAIYFKKLGMPKILTSKGSSYEILFSIKKSSSKQIYKALRREAGTKMAQEVLLKVFSPNEESYKGELESLLQTSSNYCVRLLAFEIFPKGKALVLEYIQGISIAQLIKTFNLSELEIYTLLGAIYQGLVDLKNQGLSHGDLSLYNILIDKEAQIKFIDFGKGNYQQSSQGTFPFVAPEIIQGAKSNFLSDLFSLGIIETFLKNPLLFSSFKQKKIEDFISSTNPLLASDPQSRFFPLNKNFSEAQKKEAIYSLSYKVKDFLSSTESKKYETQKIPKPSKSFSSLKHLVRQMSILLLFGIFAGASSFSTVDTPAGGFLKISTNQWVLVQLKNFKSYTPFNLSLPSGRHLLSWKSLTKEGTKVIHIKPKQVLFLNDRNFLENTDD